MDRPDFVVAAEEPAVAVSESYFFFHQIVKLFISWSFVGGSAFGKENESRGDFAGGERGGFPRGRVGRGGREGNDRGGRGRDFGGGR